MKKLFIILAILFLSIPVFAEEKILINTELPNDPNIENQMLVIRPILNEAIQNNDYELYYKASTMGYKIKKTGNPENIKIYNDFLSASAIEYSLQRYNLTKQKKFLKNAYKWSKIAVKDKTKQIYSIRADIILAGNFLNTKEMSKAYDLYRVIDIEGAKQYEQEYLEIYNKVKEIKQAIAQQKTVNYTQAFFQALQGAGSAMQQQAYYNSLQQRNNIRTNTSTHCYTIGNDLYCNSY